MRTLDMLMRQCGRLLAATICAMYAGSLGAATFVVTNTNDSGAGSLREAINSANLTLAADSITFNIPGSGVHRITPATVLPIITQPLSINGYTQPGAHTNSLTEGSDAVILIELDGSLSGGSGLTVCGSNSTIAGLSIGRYTSNAILLGNSCSVSNITIRGNFLGLTAIGTGAPNKRGLLLADADNVVIGGSAPSTRNVIANNEAGIGLTGLSSDSLRIDNNYIGTDPQGQFNRGNDVGIALLSGSALGVKIGSQAPNRIAFNIKGIIATTTAADNTFFANDFVSNVGIGIDLGDDGVTANDPNDADVGANDLQNFPVLTQALRSATGLSVQGTLDRPSGSTSLTYTIAVYANSVCDASGHGEGEHYLGAVAAVLPNGTSQNFNINVPYEGAIPIGSQITATATDATGNTSEFSSCLALDTNAPLVVTNTNDSGAGSLRQAMTTANAQGGGDRIEFNIPGAGPFTISPASALPTLTEAVLIDGYSQPGTIVNLQTDTDNAKVLIQIDGVSAGPVTGISACSSNVTLRGLSVTHFAKHGIALGQNATLAGCAGRPYFGNAVLGNFIGLTASGASGGNTLAGLTLDGSDTSVGDGSVSGRNVIGANGSSCITSGASVLSIDGNFIGVGLNGTADRGCILSGIDMQSTVAPVLIGVKRENKIAFNRQGVRVSAGAVGVDFSRNTFFGHFTLAADLDVSGAGDGVTPNDADDADTGPNNVQNFPVLHVARSIFSRLRVDGTLDAPVGAPTQPYFITLYYGDVCSGSGHGEGKWLGTVPVFINNSAEHFSFELDVAPPGPAQISATATFNNSTSEFSSCTPLITDTIFADGLE